MSFNRRPDRGADRRRDRPDRPGGDRPAGDRPRRFDAPGGGARPSGGDWHPRERPSGDRGGPPGRDRPFTPRGDRPYTPRPRFESTDEGAMSIRLDPRRAGVLKQLAADAGTRPGELVRIWVEERLDAERRGLPTAAGGGGQDLAALVQGLSERVAALERAAGTATAPDATGQAAPEPEASSAAAAGADGATGAATQETADAEASEPEPAAAEAAAPKRRRKNAVSASPADRVALHDEMIAVIGERGPLPAAELAAIITERGRYAPPRSGKPLDALTVNARVSNPTYRARFTRAGGRIGLAES